MKLYFFAVASERKAASSVIETDNTLEAMLACEALIKEGYALSDIRSVREENCLQVSLNVSSFASTLTERE